MKKGIKSYVLMGDTKAPYWQLRHNNVLIEDKKQGLRRIRYVKGAKSIFDDEISERLKTTRIDFKDGKYEAPESDKILIQYLNSHPEFGVKYKLLDPVRDAKAELKKEDTIFDAQTRIRSLDDDELEAVAIHIWNERAIMNKDTDLIKKQLLDFVKDADENYKGDLTRPEYFLEIVDLPILEMKRIVVEAINQKKIKVSGDKNTVMWADDGSAIVSVPSGKSPVDTLAAFLLEPENMETVKELGKKLEKRTSKVA